MKRIFIILLITLLSLFTVFSQDLIKGKEELFETGQYFFNREDYEEAVYYYYQLYLQDTLNANICFKIGDCYVKMSGYQVKAIKFLEQAITQISFNYKGKDFKETKAPLHALFYLGQAYRMNNELEKALKVYTKFINSPFFEGNYNVSIVENEIAATERAKTILDSPIQVQFKLFPEQVNTRAREFNPVMSGNGEHFVFVRRLKFYDAVFYMHKTNGKWSEPENINAQIISDGDHYPTSMSFDGSELYLVSQTDFNQDIYLAKRKDNKWQPVEALGKSINSRSNEIHAAVSADGKNLIFSSDRWGGQGKQDLYIATRLSDGSWGKPQNLGNKINTEFDDSYAYFTNNDQSVFFSSQGHFNMGGYDMFYINLIEKEWSIPINIGYPVSTTGDNIMYYPVENGSKLILSKFDALSSNEDIYECTILSGVKLVNEK